MITFQVKVRDPLGIHARPAGLLAKLVKEYGDTTVTLTKSGTTVRAGQLMKLMGLAVKQGDEVTVSVEGESEEEAAAAVRAFFEKNL